MNSPSNKGLQLEEQVQSYLRKLLGKDASIDAEAEFHDLRGTYMRPDILVTSSSGSCIVEVKRSNQPEMVFKTGIRQVSEYILARRHLKPKVIGGVLATNYDWYLIDANSSTVAGVINRRELDQAQGRQKLRNFILHGTIADKEIAETPLSVSDSRDIVRLVEQDERFEAEVETFKEFTYITAIITTSTGTGVTTEPISGEAGASIEFSRKWGGIRVEDPRCVKPSCKKLWGLLKGPKLDNLVNYPSGYVCSRCHCKYYLMDPRNPGHGINDPPRTKIPYKIK